MRKAYDPQTWTFTEYLCAIGLVIFIIMGTWTSVLFFIACCSLAAMERLGTKDAVADALKVLEINTRGNHRDLEIRMGHFEDLVRRLGSAIDANSKDANEIRKLAEETKQMMTQVKVTSALSRRATQ